MGKSGRSGFEFALLCRTTSYHRGSTGDTCTEKASCYIEWCTLRSSEAKQIEKTFERGRGQDPGSVSCLHSFVYKYLAEYVAPQAPLLSLAAPMKQVVLAGIMITAVPESLTAPKHWTSIRRALMKNGRRILMVDTFAMHLVRSVMLMVVMMDVLRREVFYQVMRRYWLYILRAK